MPAIRSCLWFDTQGEDAANFYVSIFPNSAITEIAHYTEAGPREAGSVMTVSFELDGHRYRALNGGPEFHFNEAISFEISCADQAEVDYYWNALSAGGKEGPCGWVSDKFGLSWQVVPTVLDELAADPDPERANRAIAAMLTMGKLDIAALQRAADGDEV